ncbi:MAG: hypothetical protein J0M07_19240 [Anaerolineae bacterium]|nr:hypothetical protein [Anaerolineae bacterium]
MRIRRQNTAWLAVLGAMVMVAALSGVASAPVTLALLTLYAFAAAASLLDFQPNQFIDRSRSSLTQMRMSAEAREAVERARRRAGVTDNGLSVLDIGLISSQSSSEGMVMRKSRAISLDDDGVRPFITLHVQPERADQQVLIRYEILDGSGNARYVHEMKTYLREGEMNILADHHLPLASNTVKLDAGDWDLRVYVDGALHAAHTFTMTPSLRERYRRFEQARDNLSEPKAAPPPKEDEPLSLEELLRSRNQQDRGQ